MQAKNIQKNYKTIIMMLGLAFLLWFMVKMSRHYEYTLDIPVRYINLDADRVFKYPQSQTIRVAFTGKGIDLLRLPFSDIFYQLDLSGRPAHVEVDLAGNLGYVRYPGELNVEVKSIITPRVLTLDLDRKVEKKLPVNVRFNLKAPPGYILVKTISTPDSVTVTGPAEMLKGMEQISTLLQNFSEKQRGFEAEFTVDQNPTYYAQYSPERIKVYFDIQRLAEKEINNVAVTIVDYPSNLQVIPLPSEAVIYVKGGERILADLEASDFQIEINFRKSWRPGSQKIKADLITNANVLYMETRPSSFDLIVQKAR